MLLRSGSMRAVLGASVGALILGGLVTVESGSARAAAPEDQLRADLGLPSIDYYEPTKDLRPSVHPQAAETVRAWLASPAGQAQVRSSQAAPGAGQTPPKGTVRMWPALDFDASELYFQEFTLRGVGKNIEVWVASGPGPDGVQGIDVRPGDCRAALPGYAKITDAQVNGLVKEYDVKILPLESKLLSVAPDRDGSMPVPAPPGLFSNENPLAALMPMDYSGDGNKVVTLVNNIRDASYYRFPRDRSGVAGYFSPFFNDLTDRNVMTIDSENWASRLGPKPLNQPSAEPCKNRSASPYGIESTFAHEYQHLLETYVDPLKATFLNEGLSEYISYRMGYLDPALSVRQRAYDAFIACFQGFRTLTTKFNPAPTPCGGAANSLSVWGDQGMARELLADYGTAHSFLLFLEDRFGADIVQRLHRDSKRSGMNSVAAALRKEKGSPKLSQVLADYQLMTLIDKEVGTNGAELTGAIRREVTSSILSSSVNLVNPASFGAAGVMPNAADYILLRGVGAAGLDGSALRSLSFAGDRGLPALPLTWSVAPRVEPPTVEFPMVPGAPPVPPVTVPSVPGPTDNPTLFSGNTPDTDASAVFAAQVPTANPTLSFTTAYNLEENFDYGYVVVSADGGKTYDTLANSFTRETVPGTPPGQAFTGSMPLPVPMTFDLSPYAGKEVLLGFRFKSDPLINSGGWYVDDVRVGDTLLTDGTSLVGVRTFSEIRPVPVDGWALAIVGMDERRGRIHVERFRGFGATLTKAQIKRLSSFPVLVAVVGHLDPNERAQTAAKYLVKVNGIGQAGGRS
ncbi:MAG: peptidase M6 immune inhibitor A [Sporichthyaceae bacterium]